VSPTADPRSDILKRQVHEIGASDRPCRESSPQVARSLRIGSEFVEGLNALVPQVGNGVVACATMLNRREQDWSKSRNSKTDSLSLAEGLSVVLFVENTMRYMRKFDHTIRSSSIRGPMTDPRLVLRLRYISMHGVVH
jgi:hypothetical protein